MQGQNYKIVIFLCILACWEFASSTNANAELSKMHDCTEIELEAVVDQDASREDNLARLSKQFFQSVNTIEHCDREQDSDDAESSTDNDSTSSITNGDGADAASDGGGAADSKTNTNAGSENANSAETNLASGEAATQNAIQLGGQSSGQSTNQVTRSAATPYASGSLVGSNFNQTITEPSSPFAAPTASNMAGTTPQPTKNETITSGLQNDAAEDSPRLTIGKTPDDIPEADNDSVFEAQIRAAAMAENDPDTKKNLWNEYRQYKGLPEPK